MATNNITAQVIEEAPWVIEEEKVDHYNIEDLPWVKEKYGIPKQNERTADTIQVGENTLGQFLTKT